VDHISIDHGGACVASTLEEMEWNAQGKGNLGYFISLVKGV
jgi:hypothetical protein